MEDDILKGYDQNHELYVAFATTIEHLVVEILEDNKINYHSVTSRVKTRESFCNKSGKSTDKYKCLADMTDIAGVRIITYFEDDVDKVANIIEAEFLVDRNNSIDKRQLLDPDRFGYLSLHHVVSLLPERGVLTEYKRFPDLKVEIQTRSILQHAWAEIEHDLGYKSKQGIPKAIRRNFSRLAGILELADKEFIEIRSDLLRYENEVRGQIEKDSSSVSIDNVSLMSFIQTNKLLKQMNSDISAICGAKIHDQPELRDMVERLSLFGIESISDLERTLMQYKDKVVKFAGIWLSRGKYESVGSTISLYYLHYVLLAETKKIKEIEEYLIRYKIGTGQDQAVIAQDIIDTYRSL